MTTMLVLSGISMGISAISKYKEGQAEKKVGKAQQQAANSQADLADYNAAVAELQAIDALERGDLEANKFRMRTRALIGEQRAGFAAGNIDVGFGSSLDVIEDAAFLGELDALTVKTNAGREAWGYQVEAEDLRRRGEITRKEGVNLMEAGKQRAIGANLQAGSMLLGGTSSLIEAKYGWGRR